MNDIEVKFYDEHRRNLPILCRMWSELYEELGYIIAKNELLTDSNNNTYRIIEIEYNISQTTRELIHYVLMINKI